MADERYSEELCHHSYVQQTSPVISLDHCSDLNHLKRVTAWIIRFVDCCRKKSTTTNSLSTKELETAENYWIKYSQHDCFEAELKIIEHGKQLSTKNNLQSLNPFK